LALRRWKFCVFRKKRLKFLNSMSHIRSGGREQPSRPLTDEARNTVGRGIVAVAFTLFKLQDLIDLDKVARGLAVAPHVHAGSVREPYRWCQPGRSDWSSAV